MAVHGARTNAGEIAGGFAHEIKTPLANISRRLSFHHGYCGLEQGRKKWKMFCRSSNPSEDIMQQTLRRVRNRGYPSVLQARSDSAGSG